MRSLIPPQVRRLLAASLVSVLGPAMPSAQQAPPATPAFGPQEAVVAAGATTTRAPAVRAPDCEPCRKNGGAGPAGSACVPCIAMNWNKTRRPQTSTASMFAIPANTGGSSRKICGVDFYTRSRFSSAVTITVSLYDSGGPWRGRLLARGPMTVAATDSVNTATFFSPVNLPANTSLYIVFDNATRIYMPLSTTGTKIPHYWWHPSYGWRGPFLLDAWNYRIRCSGTLASYVPYGAGCQGAAPGCRPCISRNWTKTLTGQAGAAARYALLDITGAAGAKICGVDLYCRAKSSPITVHVAIYDDANVVPNRMLASGSVKVGTGTAVYTATFAKPAAVGPNSVFFVVFDNGANLVLPVSKSGTVIPHYVSAGSGWSSLFVNLVWEYRVRCDEPAVTPRLSSTGVPKTGSSFSVDLSRAKPGAGALLFFGASDKTWLSLRLPFALPPAPACKILASGEILLASATNAAGQVSVPFPIPNVKSLLGQTFYNQFFVIDLKANRLGMAVSNGGKATIGDL